MHILDKMPDESVQMCITSPPYWGLRDYGTEPIIWDEKPEIMELEEFGSCSIKDVGKTIEVPCEQGNGLVLN